MSVFFTHTYRKRETETERVGAMRITEKILFQINLGIIWNKQVAGDTRPPICMSREVLEVPEMTGFYRRSGCAPTVISQDENELGSVETRELLQAHEKGNSKLKFETQKQGH